MKIVYRLTKKMWLFFEIGVNIYIEYSNLEYKGGHLMKLIFSGAAHEVTGSCHYLEACGKHILIDCGMEQGRDIYENKKIPISPAEVDYVFLTHAHIDHSGLLPLISAQGFKGSIFTTEATEQLCQIMLRDSAHIQEFEAEWKNRKAMRAGQDAVIPLYTMQDAERVLQQFVPCPYETVIEVASGIRIRFRDVGHLLGSASIEIWLVEEDVQKKIVFSGDIGNFNQPIIKDSMYVEDADYVVMESTYGDRTHGEKPDYVKELTRIIQETFDRGGNVVSPSFAVGRTQEMLYFLRQIKAEHLVSGHDNFDVYVDSPLAVEATNIFNKNIYSCFDEEAMALIKQGINPISFPGLKTSVTSDDSKAINFDEHPKVILSASGMCEAGRIRHHLKHNLWRQECTVLFVGYQAVGTLGRSLVEGASEVKLFGETIQVHAKIEQLTGISGHADKDGLIDWVRAIKNKPERIFIVHGEDSVTDSFAECLNKEYGYDAVAPYSGTEYDLLTNKCLVQAVGIPIEPKKAAARRAISVFERLVAAGRRLMAVINRNEGGANKDLAKFTDQINNLCDKWDR